MFPPLACSSSRHRGIALVIVLSCLALLTILAVAFISSVGTELTSTASYANTGDARQASQAAVNLVISQIQEATDSVHHPNQVWTSQPGMIRTFDTTGTAVQQYKLYSAGQMAVSNFNPLLADGSAAEVPQDWATRPAEYTDLNRPVVAASGRTLYPILNPAAAGPTLDTPAAGDPVVGFALSNAPGATNGTGTDIDAAPMPVQWLYMLKDGTLRAMDPASKTVAGATAADPIVSRVAFWTDDETCKVNINTAAGDVWNPADIDSTYTDMTYAGSFQQRPTFNNSFDYSCLKGAQPVQHEYQRYPGHPATTYLSAVFPKLTRDQIYALAPRVTNLNTSNTDVSSKGGTASTLADTAASSYTLPQSDGAHLYASVDELCYKLTAIRTHNMEGDFTLSSSDPSHPQTLSDTLEKTGFFLTAHSRAPEVNLFNKPRVTIWPEPVSAANRTVFDKTIAFCSTVANKSYYFVRSDPASPTNDYTNNPRNGELYSYLQGLTGQSIPGFGGNFLAKYPGVSGSASDRDQILTEIYDYIRSGINLIDTSAGAKPYAGTTSTGQIRTLKSGTGFVVPIQIGGTMGFGRSMTLYSPILHFVSTETNVDPLAITAYDGKHSGAKDGILTGGSSNEYANYARLFTRRVEVALLFDTFGVAQGPVRYVPNLVFEVSGLNTLTVAGQGNLFGADTLSTTYNTYAPNQEYAWGSFTNAANLFWNYSSKVKTLGMGTPETNYPFVSQSIVLPDQGLEVKSPMTLASGEMTLNVYTVDSLGKKTGDPIQIIKFRFPSTTVPTPLALGTLTRSYTSSSDPVVKSISRAEDAAHYYYYNNAGDPSFPSRIDTPDSGHLINSGYSGNINSAVLRETTRALAPTGIVQGDLRLVAASKSVPATVFEPVPGYNAMSAPLIPLTPPAGGPPTPNYNYGLWYYSDKDSDPDNPKSDGMLAGTDREGNTGGWITQAGRLVKEVTYANHSALQGNGANTNLGPAVPLKIQAATLTGTDGGQHPGDWDNGMGTIADGPYINKADEGEQGGSAYTSWSSNMVVSSLFAPNRQVPSPVIFGSLSTGVITQKPWQTLLFCPNPASNTAPTATAATYTHPGFGVGQNGSGPFAKPPMTTPPDHLWLDLFTMPVVEPYAISEPFSTAGKINMNYQIVPFTYIKRNTAMQAALRSVMLTAVPTADGLNYKSGDIVKTPYHYSLDLDETLKGFDRRFTQNEVFRSASQICEMFLVPKGQGATIDTVPAWWSAYQLTGDNMREAPYMQLYSRLTTRSNSYTVHVRTQSLQKVRSTAVNTWKEGVDQITGDYRGSFEIERFLDPNLTSYSEANPLPAYKFRTLSAKQFAP